MKEEQKRGVNGVLDRGGWGGGGFISYKEQTEKGGGDVFLRKKNSNLTDNESNDSGNNSMNTNGSGMS